MGGTHLVFNMLALLTRWRSWMVRVPDGPRSALSIIGWWEARRVLFNLYLLVAGSVSLGLHGAAIRLRTGQFPPAQLAVPRIALIAAIANALYALAWLYEVQLEHEPGFEGRDPVASGAFLEIGCWVVSLVLIVPALIAFLTAFGVWVRRP